MSAKRVNLISKTILDFSNPKLSKNYIYNNIKKADILDYEQADFNDLVFIDNEISVGLFTIKLEFYSLDSETVRRRLRQYGKFRVKVYDKSGLTKDDIFSKYLTDKYNMTIKSLVDLIYLCHKITQLKCFL